MSACVSEHTGLYSLVNLSARPGLPDDQLGGTGPGFFPLSPDLGPAGLWLRPQCFAGGPTPGLQLTYERERTTLHPVPWQQPHNPPLSNLGICSEHPAVRPSRGREARRKRPTGLAGTKRGGLTSGF